MKSRLITRSLATWFLCSLALMGCCTPRLETKEPDAIRVAKDEVRRRSGLSRLRVERAERLGGRWEVVIEGVPATPGGFFVVEVSDDGRVLAFHPGS